jgi:N-acetylhexosamine 1-kinase
MDSMIACINAQQNALLEGSIRTGAAWEVIKLVPTKEGKDYLEVSEADEPECWRMMVKIQHARSYKSLSEIADQNERLRMAEEAGKGLALFGSLTAGMNAAGFISPLPGYRDTALYYDQLDSVLSGNRTATQATAYLPRDLVLRRCTEQLFLVHLAPEEFRLRKEDSQLDRIIALAIEQKGFGLKLSRGLRTGNLKKVMVHGDAKLDNFLFDLHTGRVKALVDLDTVMPHTWLSDWGDMVRSLTNIAGERERDCRKIEIDLEVFKALARGYIGAARHLVLHEVELMVEAAQVMALELGVRFLADYVRGDTYFKLEAAEPTDLNKVRALVQFAVFESLGKKAAPAMQYVFELMDKRVERAEG